MHRRGQLILRGSLVLTGWLLLAVTSNIASAKAARSLTLGTAKFAASPPYSSDSQRGGRATS